MEGRKETLWRLLGTFGMMLLALGEGLMPTDSPDTSSCSRASSLRASLAVFCALGPAFRLLPALLRGVAAGLLAILILQVGYVLFGSNFHVVLPGRVYRSGQLSPEQLEWFVQRYGIRTVVNLRGQDLNADWYAQEARATWKLGISQEDLPFSAGRLPSSVGLRELVAVLERSEGPLLLHCHKGADRTGLASVIAVLLHTDSSLKEARRHLGLWTGHVAVGRTANIDRFFDLYARWLKEQDKEHSQEVFRTWARRDYCPGPARARLEVLDSTSEPRPADRSFGVRIRCTNLAVEPWQLSADVRAGIHARYQLLDPANGHPLSEGRAGLFEAKVWPGQAIDLLLPLPALGRTGRFLLVVDLVDERNGSFLQLGNEPLYHFLEVK